MTEQTPEEQHDAPAPQGEVAGALAQIDAEIAELTAMLNRHRTGEETDGDGAA